MVKRTHACAVAIALGLKAFYSGADTESLLWILGPSAWLAQWLGGIDFTYEQGAGFVSHQHRLIVGPSCAGVNFFVIALLGSYFSFAGRRPSAARWLAQSVLIAYSATVLANGLRIVVVAHLWNATFYDGVLSHEDMHRLAGASVYYTSLLAVYFVLERWVRARVAISAPLWWYLGVSLGLPLAGRLVGGNPPAFAVHATWVGGVAMLLTLVRALPWTRRNQLQ